MRPKWHLPRPCAGDNGSPGVTNGYLGMCIVHAREPYISIEALFFNLFPRGQVVRGSVCIGFRVRCTVFALFIPRKVSTNRGVESLVPHEDQRKRVGGGYPLEDLYALMTVVRFGARLL